MYSKNAFKNILGLYVYLYRNKNYAKNYSKIKYLCAFKVIFIFII